jgi:hypothetical protein
LAAGCGNFKVVRELGSRERLAGTNCGDNNREPQSVDLHILGFSFEPQAKEAIAGYQSKV